MGKARKTKAEREAACREALQRVLEGDSVANFPAIFEGFTARGIPEAEIRPRENVFTFNAWKARGRYVRRGEKGVKVITRIPVEVDDPTAPGGKRIETYPRTAWVFHVSQTEAAESSRPALVALEGGARG